MKNNEFKYVKIRVQYNEQLYESMWLEMNNENHQELVYSISENGTTDLNALKIPISERSFIVISREQLDNSVICFNFSNKKTKTPKRNIMING